MLRIFTPAKVQRFRPGLNLQTLVPEASMLTTRPPKPSYICVYILGFLVHRNPKPDNEFSVRVNCGELFDKLGTVSFSGPWGDCFVFEMFKLFFYVWGRRIVLRN